MKPALLAAFLCAVVFSNAQGYIAFTLVDTLNRQIDIRNYSVEAQSKPDRSSAENQKPGTITYDTINNFYYLKLSPSYFTSVITISVQNKMTHESVWFEIDLHAKVKSPEDFKNLLISRIPVSKSGMHIDMPSEEISWQFIPLVKKDIKGNRVEFRDLTFMQNWYY